MKPKHQSPNDIFLGEFDGGSYYLHKAWDKFGGIIRYSYDADIYLSGFLNIKHIIGQIEPYWETEKYELDNYLHQYKLAYQIAQRYLLLI